MATLSPALESAVHHHPNLVHRLLLPGDLPEEDAVPPTAEGASLQVFVRVRCVGRWPASGFELNCKLMLAIEILKYTWRI